MDTNQQAYNHSTEKTKQDAAGRHQSSLTQQISTSVGTINIHPLQYHSKTKGHSATNIGRRLVQTNGWTSRQLSIYHLHIADHSLCSGPFTPTRSHQLANSSTATTNWRHMPISFANIRFWLQPA